MTYSQLSERMRCIAGTVLAALVPCVASVVEGAESTEPIESLTRSVRSTFTTKVEKSIAEAKKEGQARECDENCSAEIEKATKLIVDCYKGRSNSFDFADRASFSQLLSKYPDVFEVPDWEANLGRVIDSRFGPGASESKEKCTGTSSHSQECAVKSAYETVGGRLFWILTACTMESIKK